MFTNEEELPPFRWLDLEHPELASAAEVVIVNNQKVLKSLLESLKQAKYVLLLSLLFLDLNIRMSIQIPSNSSRTEHGESSAEQRLGV